VKTQPACVKRSIDEGALELRHPRVVRDPRRHEAISAANLEQHRRRLFRSSERSFFSSREALGADLAMTSASKGAGAVIDKSVSSLARGPTRSKSSFSVDSTPSFTTKTEVTSARPSMTSMSASQ
jgi:hypothetical protein